MFLKSHKLLIFALLGLMAGDAPCPRPSAPKTLAQCQSKGDRNIDDAVRVTELQESDELYFSLMTFKTVTTPRDLNTHLGQVESALTRWTEQRQTAPETDTCRTARDLHAIKYALRSKIKEINGHFTIQSVKVFLSSTSSLASYNLEGHPNYNPARSKQPRRTISHAVATPTKKSTSRPPSATRSSASSTSARTSTSPQSSRSSRSTSPEIQPIACPVFEGSPTSTLKRNSRSQLIHSKPQLTRTPEDRDQASLGHLTSPRLHATKRSKSPAALTTRDVALEFKEEEASEQPQEPLAMLYDYAHNSPHPEPRALLQSYQYVPPTPPPSTFRAPLPTRAMPPLAPQQRAISPVDSNSDNEYFDTIRLEFPDETPMQPQLLADWSTPSQAPRPPPLPTSRFPAGFQRIQHRAETQAPSAWFASQLVGTVSPQPQRVWTRDELLNPRLHAQQTHPAIHRHQPSAPAPAQNPFMPTQEDEIRPAEEYYPKRSRRSRLIKTYQAIDRTLNNGKRPFKPGKKFEI